MLQDRTVQDIGRILAPAYSEAGWTWGGFLAEGKIPDAREIQRTLRELVAMADDPSAPLPVGGRIGTGGLELELRPDGTFEVFFHVGRVTL